MAREPRSDQVPNPGDDLYVPGAEYLLCAASIEQARLCFRFIRAALEPLGGYRFIDSATRIGITHLRTFTRLRVLSSNGKTAMGIVGCPMLVADEPGSWEVTGGQLMHDAIQTAQVSKFLAGLGQPERRGETALPDGPAIKGRSAPARLPARFSASGKCTSHLGFGLVQLEMRFVYSRCRGIQPRV